jgi:hypothetical protein
MYKTNPISYQCRPRKLASVQRIYYLQVHGYSAKRGRCMSFFILLFCGREICYICCLLIFVPLHDNGMEWELDGNNE